MDRSSWTNNLSWVEGYANVLGSMQKLSARFAPLLVVDASVMRSPE